MVASSGFSRMHSFSTFTARADWAEEGTPVRLKMFDRTKPETFPRGSRLAALLKTLSSLEPNRAGGWARRGDGHGEDQSAGLLRHRGVSCG